MSWGLHYLLILTSGDIVCDRIAVVSMIVFLNKIKILILMIMGSYYPHTKILSSSTEAFKREDTDRLKVTIELINHFMTLTSVTTMSNMTYVASNGRFNTHFSL